MRMENGVASSWGGRVVISDVSDVSDDSRMETGVARSWGGRVGWWERESGRFLLTSVVSVVSRDVSNDQ